MAQAYAEQCVFGSNDNRVSKQSTFSSVGENIGANVLPHVLLNYTSMVEQWNNEAEDSRSRRSPGEVSDYRLMPCYL